MLPFPSPPSLSLPFPFLSFSLGRLTSAIDESLRGSCEGSLSLLHCLFTSINSLHLLYTLISHSSSLIPHPSTPHPLIPTPLLSSPLLSPLLPRSGCPSTVHRQSTHPSHRQNRQLPHPRTIPVLYSTVLYVLYKHQPPYRNNCRPTHPHSTVRTTRHRAQPYQPETLD